jgi:serine/threonine-protein kinase PknG
MAACTHPAFEDGYCTSCGIAQASVVPAGPVLAGSVPGGGGPSGAATGGLGGATVPPRSAAATAGQPMSYSSGPVSGYSAAGTASGSGSSGSGRSGSRRGSRGSGGRSRASRGRLGAGLVEVPPVPYRDPATAVLANPQVPEQRRYCGKCDQPVGRSRDGRPGLAEGFCRNCGTRFSFRPKLEPGEVVAGQYKVLGCLAHGGLGWIYLAQDRNVSDRWVVLKGLLNTGDADAMAAALAERQFLAEVEHPNIVRIYNFVTHPDRATGEASGYIVMEYVGGKSLKQILEDARAGGRSVELKHALAYAIEVLPALGYLHDRGMVYCDFKPDNVIQTEEQLKLIDMGGVRRIDSDEPIYGTVGYQAPEIADAGPSVESDLYTVGRALAVLTFEFRGYQREFKYTLPDGVPLLQQYESFRRLLLRATHTDPARRFSSAGEMVDQLTGVLREVVALETGEPKPAYSRVFSPELRAVGTDGAASIPAPVDVVTSLPVPQVDGTDPAAGYLATLAALDPEQRAAALLSAVAGDAGVPPAVAESPETWLALVRARIDTGDLAGAADALREQAARDPGDWRIAWLDGLRQLAAGAAPGATAAFNAVYDELPGEIAPKLALAIAAEAAGDIARADRYYSLVWTTDLSYVSAAFGLARTRLASGDRRGAIAALARVPTTSSYHVAAQTAAVRMLVSGAPGGGRAPEDDLRQAADLLARLPLDATARHELMVVVLRAALDWTSGTTGGRNGAAGGRAPVPRQAGVPLLGCDLTERSLRFGLESNYRALARLTSEETRRIQLVDMANSVRPRTWT